VFESSVAEQVVLAQDDTNDSNIEQTRPSHQQ
jgi:hypothetical protein